MKRKHTRRVPRVPARQTRDSISARKPTRGHDRQGEPESTSTSRFSCDGLLELHPKGYGFLRSPERDFQRNDDDVFVSESLVSKHQLQQGSWIVGQAIQKSPDQRGRVETIALIDGQALSSRQDVIPFDQQMPTNPHVPLKLELSDTGEQSALSVSMRVLDLFCPIGMGQRALIAAPPRAEKTTLLKQIGRSIARNHPDVKLLTLLIDERPEEITDMRDELPAEIYASSLDQPLTNHARLSQLVIDRCQRLVERGENVVLLVDSLTRMTRAFNKIPVQRSSSKNSSGHCSPMGPGGLRVDALEIPRSLFASARALRGGGSLTIVATVLIETENRMDEVIYREFKGTGNMDLVLSQSLADQSIWPAIDLRQSATRRVELLQNSETLAAVNALKRTLLNMPLAESVKELVSKLKGVETNEVFLDLIRRSLE